MSGEITFTQAKYEALKRAHTKAIKEGVESFAFEGHGLLTAYAGYLLDYLAPKFGPVPPPGYTAEELDRDNPHNQWMHE